MLIKITFLMIILKKYLKEINYKKISLQDPDEDNFGRMKEYFEYLKISGKQLKISIKETNLSSSQ